MHSLSFRPATEADIDFLVQLAQKTMNEHLLASGITRTPDEYLQRVRFRFECAQLILFKNQPAGLLKLAREGTAWEIIQIQLCPTLQGRGLGRRLLTKVITQARKAQAALTLSVLKANPARNLYKRLGFVVAEETEHAFTMRLEYTATAPLLLNSMTEKKPAIFIKK